MNHTYISRPYTPLTQRNRTRDFTAEYYLMVPDLHVYKNTGRLEGVP